MIGSIEDPRIDKCEVKYPDFMKNRHIYGQIEMRIDLTVEDIRS